MRSLLILVLVLAVGGCKSEPDPSSSTEKIVDDNQTLKEASAAANEVVRAAGDCEAVKAALPAARQKLSEVEGRVRTQTGKVSLAAIKKRMEDVASMCPS
jgi:hypothetical protein